MRVLLISHTVLSRTGNMGKTLLSYLSDFKADEVAQLYIHAEVPTDDTVCVRYYRFTDFDAIQSIIMPSYKGKSFSIADIEKERIASRVDEGIARSAYVLGSKRKAWSKNIRELVWRLARWNNSEVKKWVEEFAPDIVLYASGDYAFMYDLAFEIAEMCNKPLVTICVDDYYLHNHNHGSLLGRIHYRYFMRSVRRTIDRSSCIFVLSDKMKTAYEEYFDKQCFTVHNSVEMHESGKLMTGKQISYIGNLGFGRIDQLIDIGKALAYLRRDTEPISVDIYTGTFTQSFLDRLESAEGIRLHGRIGAEEVMEVMKKSMLVIHTESFDQEIQDQVRYSVSTKIAESLMYGPCLLAYGPEGIASIDYLKDNDAAYVITSKDQLESGLKEIIENAQLRDEIVSNARRLAKENHSIDVNPKKVRKWIEEAIVHYAGL